ncbi:MAG: acetylornithine/succinylornithine family transaminase [Solobacterium sp.]|nr:acetylornithine/succinylornithine family transaminase [Solobacterium sp.]
MSRIQNLDHQYIASTYGRFPVVIKEGKGSVAVDENGRMLIDMGSGIAVNVFGYADERWKKAVISQLDKVSHTSNLYYTEPDVKLAKMLCDKSGMKKVFYCNSGAEANECAIKAARKYAAEKKGNDYYTIITLEHSFHGRTLTTLAATGQDVFHQLFTPLTPGFVHAKINDLEDVKRLAEENKTAAIMIECIQGEGGVNVLDEAFVQGIRELCDEKDLIMIVDEVQTGNGRTGVHYSYQNYNILPDVVTTAKGLGGGLPIGVTMLSDKVENIFAPGDNGSTFGGNPVVCAGACSILERLDSKMLAGVKQRSEYIFARLKDARGVRSVSGMGLMIGIEPENGSAGDIANKCLEKGVLVLTAHGNKVRLLPALNIPMDLLEKAMDIITEAFE